MKLPKLKHTVLCQLILYLPALSFLFGIILIGFMGNTLGYWSIAVFFAGVGLSLWYLFGNLVILLGSDMLFSSIRCWKKARLWFESDCNGRDRKTAEQKLLRRCKRWGKPGKALSMSPAPLSLWYRCSKSSTFYWHAIEKIGLIYSAEVLDEAVYQEILRSAKANATALRRPREETPMMDRRQKDAPVACAVAVVILAQRVEASVTEQAVKAFSGRYGCMVPCVAELSTGRYYFDSLAKPYMQGATQRPERNYAIGLVRKLVFGGKLPLRGNERYLPLEQAELSEIAPELSLWEFIGTYRRHSKEADREEKRRFQKLRDGEVLLEEEVLYCKLKDRMTYILTLPEEGGEQRLQVLMDGEWDYPKRQKMSKKDQAELKQRIEAFLIPNGYRPVFVKENDENLARALDRLTAEEKTKGK